MPGVLNEAKPSLDDTSADNLQMKRSNETRGEGINDAGAIVYTTTQDDGSASPYATFAR